jgi:hypothetical protein
MKKFTKVSAGILVSASLALTPLTVLGLVFNVASCSGCMLAVWKT